MTEIYIIRHAKTEMNEKKMIIGHLDPSILPSAATNIKKIAKRLRKIKFDAIYSSDLKRAYQTAKIISENLEYPARIVKSPEIREIDYGILSGKLKEDAKKDYPDYHDNIGFINPNGESFKRVYSRVTLFLNKIAKKHGKFLVVTHSGCIRAIYSYCNNNNFEDNINMKVPHDIIIKCVIKDKNKKTVIL
jgi:broad specificity phosphatase PhoE